MLIKHTVQYYCLSVSVRRMSVIYCPSDRPSVRPPSIIYRPSICPSICTPSIVRPSVRHQSSFRLSIVYRPSVCPSSIVRLSVRPSVRPPVHHLSSVCLSDVYRQFVHHHLSSVCSFVIFCVRPSVRPSVRPFVLSPRQPSLTHAATAFS